MKIPFLDSITRSRALRSVLLLVLLSLTACSPATATQQPTTTSTPLLPTPTIKPSATPVPMSTPEPPELPFSVPGSYAVGKRLLTFEDASRNNRKVTFTLWYPALRPADAGDSVILPGRDHEPDRSGAPYPLLLSSTEHASTFARYLVSRGFVWASVNGIHSYSRMRTEMYSQPLDILSLLNRVASGSLEGMESMVDTENTGVMGYSFDGYNTLAMSGARIDSEFLLEQCADPVVLAKEAESESGLSPSFKCDPAQDWDAFTAQVGSSITTSQDGLWQPMTDERIRAVMPMAGEGWGVFGERGLAAVDRPVLILVATDDLLYPENVIIYEHIGTPDKAFISFLNLDHMMVFYSKHAARMAHFMVAFFGYHLQGREDYAYYFSEEFVAQFDDLAWGVVKQ